MAMAIDTVTATVAETGAEAGSATTTKTAQRLPITVTKPTPYTFDLGNLLALDANPLPNTDEATLHATARDSAQALLNQLLSTCPIASTPQGVHLSLPAPQTALPREKPVPAAKPMTKWAAFALKAGIKDKKKGAGEAGGKMVYDEAKGDWVPKWGYKGKNKEAEGQWLVEVDEKKEARTGEVENERAAGRRERKERVRRNERRERANDRRGRKMGA